MTKNKCKIIRREIEKITHWGQNILEITFQCLPFHEIFCIISIFDKIKNLTISRKSKTLPDALIYLSINPKYSIPLLGRFTLIIHQNCSRTLVERQFYKDCFAYSAQMNVAICTIKSLFLEYFKA